MRKAAKISLSLVCALLLLQHLIPATSAASTENPWQGSIISTSRGGEVNDKLKKIAITFDDGPHGEYTEVILDILKKYSVHATFFVVGTNVREHPELVLREISEGHEVGNHTNTHPCAVNKLNTERLRKEIIEAEDAIYEVADYRPHLFRPPGGLKSGALINILEEMDYNIMLWSVDTLDWKKATTLDYVLKTVRKGVKDGSVILFHDYVVRDRSVSAEALDILIPELLSQGYEFVLASEIK